ncbi:hypothetical protein HO133_007369 [Letharia lupina]|uniref:CorA-like transporter domain-containing protein n=1 Tax=Letharia lupina TaxID=560253 RepID=A0A8H6FIN1_9LECA|nr:uncharacterized protein HO133_007369 [Letharia lupina]KAF6229253.1 hypothetical protein HO133_007369 [Letharia lupina]
MEPSLTSYHDAKNYPRNVADRTLTPFALDAISHQLNTQAPRLFAEEAQAALDSLDLAKGAKDFWPTRIKSTERLREHLGILPFRNPNNHQCRFLFIHAAHSRDKLKISREMLMLCFTHFQVMPEFVEFLFPFGFQSYAQDFYFSGFRQRTQLAERRRNNAPAPNARPVDKRYQICCNLKSVEPSDSDGWSIRHCAVHHSFDMNEVRTSWIIVKGDEQMKQRIESAISDRGRHEPSDFESLGRAFETSLETHLIFCDWSAENWRWYINSLEEKFQSMTRRTFSAPVYVPFVPAAATDQFTLNPRTNTDISKYSMFSRTRTNLTEKRSLKPAMKQRLSAPQTYENPDTGISQPLPPDEDDDDDDGDKEPESPLKPNDVKAEDETRDFSFGKLRKVHNVAEKANEAVLVLKQNIIVLTQLKRYYRSISSRKDFPKDRVENCEDAIDGFELRIGGLENDMQTQILRLETLLRLLEDRKTLLHSILDYQNTQANKYSTKSMFTMTEDMNDIARKTKVETVSMKVITLVTLFFLPGTFISTLMSTEIFQSDYTGRGMPNPYANLNPVQIYLALSLPLTVVTLLFWAGFHFWEMRHEKQKKKHHKAAGWQV